VRRSIYIFRLENLKRKYHSEDLGVDGKMILGLILGKYGGNMWTGFIRKLKIHATIYGREQKQRFQCKRSFLVRK